MTERERSTGDLLGEYLERVQVRPGNGLSRCMNQTIRSYPHVGKVIRHVGEMLIQTEEKLAFSGVYVRTDHAYWNIVHNHDEWGRDVPVVKRASPMVMAEHLGQLAELAEDDSVQFPDHDDDPALAGDLAFTRIATLPYSEFAAAMTIARRIGLICGHGKVGLTPSVRAALKRRSK